MSALDDRRQAAIVAFDDARRVPDTATLDALDIAIETATLVCITPEIIEAFGTAWHAEDDAGTHVRGARRAAGLRAAFRAAGFEVEA